VRCAGDVPVCDPKTMYECETPALIHYVRHNEADNCHCPRHIVHVTTRPTTVAVHVTLSTSLRGRQLSLSTSHCPRHYEADNCHCPRQCRRRSYRYRISQARLSNFIALTAKNIWKSSESVDKILNDHCSLEVSSQ